MSTTSGTAWTVVQDAEVVTPVMDDYLMKCCDCGLVHRLRFRAIEVKAHHADGTFEYDELDPTRFRVELTAWREDEDTPLKNGQTMAELASAEREHLGDPDRETGIYDPGALADVCPHCKSEVGLHHNCPAAGPVWTPQELVAAKERAVGLVAWMGISDGVEGTPFRATLIFDNETRVVEGVMPAGVAIPFTTDQPKEN